MSPRRPDNSVAREIIVSLVASDPGMAAQLVTDLVRERGDNGPALPDREEVARALRGAMAQWVEALGPLGKLIGPVREDGTLFSLALATSERNLSVMWVDDRDLPEVMEMSQAADRQGWLGWEGRTLDAFPGWDFRFTHSQLRRSLDRALKRFDLTTDCAPSLREEAWALSVMIARGSTVFAIPLDVLEEGIVALSELDLPLSASDRRAIAILSAEVEASRATGATHLQPPWGEPDLPPTGALTVDGLFSPAATVARAEQIVGGAIEIYEQLIEQWLPQLKQRLQTSVTLPARFVGDVVLDHDLGPRVDWRFEALPERSANEIRVRLGETSTMTRYEQLMSLVRRNREMRPDSAEWLGASTHGGPLEIYGAQPATALAYTWLRSDLARVAWSDRS